jgi:hypothetical protein
MQAGSRRNCARLPPAGTEKAPNRLTKEKAERDIRQVGRRVLLHFGHLHIMSINSAFWG